MKQNSTLIRWLLISSFFVTGQIQAQDSTVIYTTADTYVQINQTSASTPNGSSKQIQVKFGAGMATTDKGATPGTTQRTSFIKYNVNTIDLSKNISAAYIRLRVYTEDSYTATYFKANGIKVSKVSDNTWTEAGLLWTNQPSFDAVTDSITMSHFTDALAAASAKGKSNPSTLAGVNDSSTYFYTDITNYIKSLQSGGILQGDLSFAIQGISDRAASVWTSGATGSTGSYYYSRELANSISGAAFAAPAIVVYYEATTPVRSSALRARQELNTVKLNWETYNEVNASKFLVQRSVDGVNFTTLDELSAVGNSTQTEYYSYSDKNPLNGKNYYRWQEIDLDGKSQYSNVAVVDVVVKTLPVVIYPNPVKAGTSFIVNLLGNTATQLKLVDLNGKTVLMKNITSNIPSVSVSTHGLTPGTYFVVVGLVRTKILIL